MIENTHPKFILENYSWDSEKSEFMRDLSQCNDIWELYIRFNSFLSNLQDAHTQVAEPAYLDMEIIDANLQWVDDDLYILYDDDYEQVLQFGHIEIKDLRNLIDTVFAHENPQGVKYNRQKYINRKYLLEYCGVHTADGNSVEILLGNGQKVMRPFTKYETSPAEKAFHYLDHDEDTVLIRSYSCTFDSSFNVTKMLLEGKMKKGLENIVFDNRKNTGGTTSVWTELLNMLGIKNVRLGAKIRYSQEALSGGKFDSQYVFEQGICTIEPSKGYRENDDINIYVLTSEETFSSGASLATYIHDGDYGYIAGSASRNTPSSYGDIVVKDLPFSGLYLGISCKYLERPEPAYGNLPLSSIDIPDSDDPLEFILALISENDP